MYEHVVASSHCSGVLDTVVEHAGNAGQRAEVLIPRFPAEEHIRSHAHFRLDNPFIFHSESTKVLENAYGYAQSQANDYEPGAF
jgi:hypothetical protein